MVDPASQISVPKFAKFPQTLNVAPAFILKVAPELIVMFLTDFAGAPAVTVGWRPLGGLLTIASIAHEGVEPQSPQFVEVVNKVSDCPDQIAFDGTVEIGVAFQFKVNPALVELFQLFSKSK